MKLKRKFTALLASLMICGSLGISVYANDTSFDISIEDSYSSLVSRKLSKNLENNQVILFKEYSDQSINRLYNDFDTDLNITVEDPENVQLFGLASIDGENVPLLISGDEITDTESIEILINKALNKYIENTDDANTRNPIIDDTDLKSSPASDYSLIGRAIKLTTTNTTIDTEAFYQEYRWYEGGTNGDVDFYYLRKDFEGLDLDHVHNLMEYTSEFSEYNNSYSADFLDPQPEDGSRSGSFSISYPWGISWSFTNNGDDKINLDYSSRSDTALWTVNSWKEIRDFQFKQGVFIESDTRNRETTVRDEIVTTSKYVYDVADFRERTLREVLYISTDGNDVDWND